MATKNINKNESVNEVKNNESKAIVQLLGAHGTLVIGGCGLTKREDIVDADFEEVKDEPVVATLPQVTFSTYTTKKGDKAPQIIGFGGEDDPRWARHKEAKSKCVSASYRRDLNGEKVYILMFGVRYMDVAKALCGAYNTDDRTAWQRAEDACQAIYEQAQRDGKARWEAKKAEWKAKAEEKKAAKEQGKCYKPEDVAAMLQNILNGGDVPEEVKKLMAA